MLSLLDCRFTAKQEGVLYTVTVFHKTTKEVVLKKTINLSIRRDDNIRGCARKHFETLVWSEAGKLLREGITLELAKAS